MGNIKKIAVYIFEYLTGSKKYLKFFRYHKRYEKATFLLKVYYQFRCKKILQHYCASIRMDTIFEDVPKFPHALNGIFIASGAK